MGSDRIAIASAERSGSSKTAFIAAIRRGPVERSEKDPDVPGGRKRDGPSGGNQPLRDERRYCRPLSLCGVKCNKRIPPIRSGLPP